MMTNSANGFRLVTNLLDLVSEGEHPLLDLEKFDSSNSDVNNEYLSNWWKYYDL